MDAILLIAILIAAAAFYYFAQYSKPQDDDWQKLPTLPEYLLTHPDCKTNDPESAKCYHCDSDKVIFQPLTAHNDPRYKHLCFTCKKILFRSKAIMS